MRYYEGWGVIFSCTCCTDREWEIYSFGSYNSQLRDMGWEFKCVCDHTLVVFRSGCCCWGLWLGVIVVGGERCSQRSDVFYEWMAAVSVQSIVVVGHFRGKQTPPSSSSAVRYPFVCQHYCSTRQLRSYIRMFATEGCRRVFVLVIIPSHPVLLPMSAEIVWEASFSFKRWSSSSTSLSSFRINLTE